MTHVPNLFPKVTDPQGRRLAIVGEAPGTDEETAGEPFVGASGRLLRLVLSQSGINPAACFIGNVCQVRPPTDIEDFDYYGPEIQEGTSRLVADLDKFRPHAVLVLGRTAFRFFNEERCWTDAKGETHIPIQDWRGSVWISPVGNYKCIAAFHPSYILRVFSDIAYFRVDVARAVKHSSSPSLVYTRRDGILRPTVDQVLQFLQRLTESKHPASFDIEGYSDSVGVTMLSIADTPTTGIVIPFYIDGTDYWSEDDEILVWKALADWLANPLCPKRAHNAFYETAVLGWRHSCVVAGIIDDTMMKHWECFNELEKSLGVCVSMWIEEPYYKDERESSGDRKLLYNFKDSACTEEISRAMDARLAKSPRQREHYDFNVDLINPFTYMHLRGTRFDAARAAQHIAKAESEHDVLLSEINKVVEADLGHPFNAKSADDKCWFLYDYLGQEPSKRWGRTSKEEMLHRYYKKTGDATLQKIIQAVSLRTRISDVQKFKPHADGRVRTSYDLLADTGRSKSRSSSITEIVGYVKSGANKGKPVYGDFGTNLQAVTKPIRDTFVPDNADYLFWQADLEGADAWTVAADLAALGDDRMLHDLQHGVKPAKLLLRMLEELEAGRDPSTLAKADAATAAAECKKVIVLEGTLPDGRPANWKYTCMKRVQHGTNYLAKEDTISATIFKDSDGVIDVPPSTIVKYQMLYLMRYNITKRRNYIANELSTKGTIETAAGTRRRFFGIRNPRMVDEDVIRAAMASEPQTNTTYITNRALLNLWSDPRNRRQSGALFIEPLLQVHDALAGQFPVRLRAFVRDRLATYFNIPIRIHGIDLVIPVDIKCGPSWGETKEEL